MNKRIWIILIAFGIILLLNNIKLFGNSAFANFIDFVLTLTIIIRAYKIYKAAGETAFRLPPSPVGKFTSPVIPSKQIFLSPRTGSGPVKKSTNPVLVVAAIFMLVILFAAYPIVSAGSINFFVWGDNLLGAGEQSPVLIWLIAGLFTGAITGSIIVWLKYHFQFRWCLITIAPAMLLFLFLQVNSVPLDSIEPQPVALKKDPLSIAEKPAAAIVTREKKRMIRIPVKSMTDSSVRESAPKVALCNEELSAVTINARSDSVNVYYRTAAVKGGIWSEWRSKFVPQQGQFSLTDNGPVTANGLQYYYESKSVFTRSSQNPYTRLLCDGELIIDTY